MFLQEARSLEEEAVQFSREFPEAAKLLDPKNAEDRDPYVERLIESFVFLATRVRETSEDVSELFARDLLEQFEPELLAPLPSVSVVKFAPYSRSLPAIEVPAGAIVRSDPVEKSPEGIPFCLLHPVPVNSARLRSARLTETEFGGDAHLEMEFVWASIRGDNLWPDQFRMFLFGDTPLVWALRYALSRRVAHAELWHNGRWIESSLSFTFSELPCYTTETSQATPLTFARDFMCSDERFRFVDIQGLREQVLSTKKSLRLRVHFKGPLPRGLARGVDASTFQLHAGVVVNRSPEALQGTSWDHTQSEIPIRPLGGDHREVLEVRSVRGFDMAQPHRSMTYRKYSSHAWGAGQGIFHVTKRRNSKGSVQTLLGLGFPNLNEELTSQNLAIDALCGDGDHPYQLVPAAKLSKSGKGVPSRVTVKGLVRPSPCHRMSDRGAINSMVLALMQGHNHGWMDAERLKDGLRHVLWDLAESKRTLVETIQTVSTANTFTLIKGIPWRLMDVEMRLRDTTCTHETWDRLGLLDAFGSVLWRFVRNEIPLGARGRLRVHIEPAGAVFEYGDSNE